MVNTTENKAKEEGYGGWRVLFCTMRSRRKGVREASEVWVEMELVWDRLSIKYLLTIR